MAKIKSKSVKKLNYSLVISALLIFILVGSFQTLRMAWFRTTNNFFYPYLNVPNKIKYFAADRSLRLYSKQELANEMSRLQNSNQLFATKVAQLGKLTVENEKLRSLLKLPKRSNFNYIPAEIILRDPLRWKESFTINRGYADGIYANTAVLCFNANYPNQAILAGIIKTVAKHSAQVITVLNPHFCISGYFAKANTHGIINGDTGQAHRPDEINISFLSTRKEFELGEKCFSSGFEHQIPAGFLIGSLKEMDLKNQIFSSALYLSAKITPAAKLDNVSFVIVATPRTERGL